jgi:hypothetical protein
MPSSEQGYRLTVKSLLLDANGKFPAHCWLPGDWRLLKLGSADMERATCSALEAERFRKIHGALAAVMAGSVSSANSVPREQRPKEWVGSSVSPMPRHGAVCLDVLTRV